MNIHLLSLLVFLRDVCAGCRPPVDDPVYRALVAKFERIDLAVADFAAEIAAVADDELAELVAGWSE